MKQTGSRILTDGLNLSLTRGTGITTYSRTLIQALQALEAEVGVIYGRDRRLKRKSGVEHTPNDILFFDAVDLRGFTTLKRLRDILDIVSVPVENMLDRPRPCCYVPQGAYLDLRHIDRKIPVKDPIYNIRRLFERSATAFRLFGQPLTMQSPHPFDVFHATTPLPIRLKGARHITTIHDLIPLTHPFATLDDKKFFYNVVRSSIDDSDLVIAVSEATAASIRRLFPQAAGKLQVTYQSTEFAINRDTEPLATGFLEKVYNLKAGQYFLFVGAIEPKKNVGRLIDAYFVADTDTPLVIVGRRGWLDDDEAKMSGHLKTVFEEKTREEMLRLLGGRGGTGMLDKLLNNRIIFLDYVPFRHLRRLYEGARALVFPSVVEGFGLPALEAMTLGCPVITSTDPALMEVTGEAALNVDPFRVDAISDAIARLDNDAEKRAELREKGYRQAGFFSPERYNERLAAAYGTLGTLAGGKAG
jgi:glycosyltransferase involved in cell wall biosynthesis